MEKLSNLLETFIGHCADIALEALEPYGRYYEAPRFDFGVRGDLERAFLAHAVKGDSLEAELHIEQAIGKMNRKIEETMVPRKDFLFLAPDFRAYKADFLKALPKETGKEKKLQKS